MENIQIDKDILSIGNFIKLNPREKYLKIRLLYDILENVKNEDNLLSIESIIEENIKLLNELDNSITISVNSNTKEVFLNSDKEQLSRVFFNLIKNSIESIQQKAENDSNLEKKITIEVNEENNHIMINIIDNGIGFGVFATNIKDILNPYFTTKKNGTGLGLSIVSKTINDHNGKIEFIPLEEGAKIKIDFIK